MRHNIVPSPPLIRTAESEAGRVQRCAALCDGKLPSSFTQVHL